MTKIKCFCKGTKLLKVFLENDSYEKDFIDDRSNNCEKIKSKVINALNGEKVDFKENIDWDLLNLTDFQRDVLQETFKIKHGKIKTYKEIAEAINSKAYRAVGNALNKNPVPIVIGCHRVIGSNKKLTGFRLGLELKKQLLINEGHEIIGYKVI
ncbi:MAG: methylated-DNA--[protein]-cysteine S-methyltransferase [Methanobrevibacter sp.]|jgi:methylated-DNA-[protein]-cysteine S-methyltransferase|nr:methylated-DNA--[protein]-cysteine S-methyltransferase [Methanobrevibacter sp.]